jgi:hypothetical protein
MNVFYIHVTVELEHVRKSFKKTAEKKEEEKRRQHQQTV